jgi:hypothetical protein
MTAVLKLTGYDKTTEYMATADTVPYGVRKLARTLAGVAPSERHLVGMYPLTPEQAGSLAERAKIAVDLERLDYFLEEIAENNSRLARKA